MNPHKPQYTWKQAKAYPQPRVTTILQSIQNSIAVQNLHVVYEYEDYVPPQQSRVTSLHQGLMTEQKKQHSHDWTKWIGRPPGGRRG